MSQSPPFDDTVHLDDMPVDFSESDDTAAIIPNESPVAGRTTTTTTNEDGEPEITFSQTTAHITVAILLLINLLNYMDRFTIAGVLLDITKYYDISDEEAGLIQTSFVISYMVFSPLFGYLGDRYIRKRIMAVGIFSWSCFTLISSFMPSDKFYAFIIFRALVGIGEASYSTIAPTIIADMFVKGKRTTMLMVFYFAIPVGSGLGYIVGSKVAEGLGAWQWALRVTPILGVICVVLIILLTKEPPRGMSEGGTSLHNTSLCTDLKEIFKVKSFVLSTIGFTCVAFVTGALALWAPSFMVFSMRAQGGTPNEADVSLIFGLITVAAGFLGVALGAQTARRYRTVNPRADPLVCAMGLLTCVPFLYFALLCSEYNTLGTWMLIFMGETMLCLNWSIVADILLYTIIPTRRSTAEAVQILFSHALGDAGSPYLIGVISDALRRQYPGREEAPSVRFASMQSALYLTTFISVLGGGAFLANALFIERDRKRAEKLTKDLIKKSGVPPPELPGITDHEVVVQAPGQQNATTTVQRSSDQVVI